MAWTTPRTWTTGETVTAAMLNTNVRDNSLYLFSPPGFVGSRTSNQTIASGTNTAVLFTAADQYDTDTMHDSSGAPSTITFTTAGVYHVFMNVEFAANATGTRRAWIAVDSTNVPICEMSSSAIGGSDNVIMNISAVYKAAAGATAQAWVYQTSGGNLSLLGTGSGADGIGNVVPCSFGAQWLGAGT